MISLLSAMSPGPDFVVVSRYAMCQSRRQAIACSLGVALGILFHVSYCVLGLAVILTQSLWLFNAIKWCGAIYLTYLGLKSLICSKISSKQTPQFNEKSKASSLSLAFKEGFLVNLLNPKCTLFILSVFTLLIEPTTPKWLQFSYGLDIAAIGLAWFCLLASCISLAVIQKHLVRFQYRVEQFTGVVLIVIALKIILL